MKKGANKRIKDYSQDNAAAGIAGSKNEFMHNISHKTNHGITTTSR